MTENTPGSLPRRTVVAGAAWTVPVVATAIGAPLAAASGETPPVDTSNFDQYLSYLASNVNVVGPDNAPLTDGTVYNAGPTAAPGAYVVVRVPAAYVNIPATNANWINTTYNGGWTLTSTYGDGPYAVWAFKAPIDTMAAGTAQTLRFYFHTSNRPDLTATSFTVDYLVQTLPGESNPGNNVWTQSNQIVYYA